ncbi:MAG: insulinase family protein [candidate division WOR-3 bacterium]|nr:insulinase family protein [candidate division WOR-3 bacterium]MDH5683321.1 insulinase family protein [candidate division WOR-3 bacterium]
MTKDLINKTLLPSGLRVITEKLPYLHSIALGIIFDRGSRDEAENEQGISHLLEHMFFKGTTNRTAREISIFAESKGTIIDGFTSKENTGVYARFLSENFAPIIDLSCEVLSSPLFAANELEKEKGVIYEEIKSAQEDPEDQMLNLLFKVLYEPHPMGFPITGTLQSLEPIDAQALRNYYQKNYGKRSAIVVGVGEIEHNALCDLISEKLNIAQDDSKNSRMTPNFKKPNYQFEPRQELTQVFVSMAKPIFSFQDERRYALSVLNTALGGGLSSRLFQRLREEEGLVYTISSFVDLFLDSGILGVYFVTDYKKLAKGINTVLEEINKLRQQKFQPEEFETASNLTKSSILLALENPLSRMMRLAKTELLLKRVLTVDETLAAYNRLTLDSLNTLIEEVLPDDDFFISCVGPLKENDLHPFFT